MASAPAQDQGYFPGAQGHRLMTDETPCSLVLSARSDSSCATEQYPVRNSLAPASSALKPTMVR